MLDNAYRQIYGCRMRLFFRSFPAMVALLFLSGCSTAPQPQVKYVDPGAPGDIVGTGIESQDIKAAAQKAAQSMVNLPALANAAKPPIIQIAPVVNRSASPIDTTLYTAKLRNALMQAGAGPVKFLARDVSWKSNNDEQKLRNAGDVESKDGSRRVGASYDYLLTAELQGISTASSKGQSDYFLITFKLVDFKDLLIWTEEYEIKKEGTESAVYR